VDKTPALMEAFLKAHPGAHYVRFADFLSYKLVSNKIRMISGFGEMGWLSPEAFAAAEPDFVSAGARGAVDHMNKDHAHDVLAMSRAFASLPLAKQATLLAIDRYGLDVLCEMPDGSRRSRVAFATRLDRPEQIKDAVVSLTKAARTKLITSRGEGERGAH
jgi:putative heme iron utilization protein